MQESVSSFLSALQTSKSPSKSPPLPSKTTTLMIRSSLQHFLFLLLPFILLMVNNHVTNFHSHRKIFCPNASPNASKHCLPYFSQAPIATNSHVSCTTSWAPPWNKWPMSLSAKPFSSSNFFHPLPHQGILPAIRCHLPHISPGCFP